MLRNIFLTALLLTATGATAEIYSWRDADGTVHFSDQAPASDNGSVRVLNLPAESAPAAPAPRATPAAKSAAGTAKKPPAPAENNENSKQAACDNAKKATHEFQDSPRRAAVSSRGGKRSFNAVDGEERAEKEAELQKAIDKACNP